LSTSFTFAAPRSPRSPWQRLYAAAHRRRLAHWSPRARALPAPVVSVGNLHWGGGGKTPLVAAIAQRLQSGGWRPAILSRGWGRRDPRRIAVVSDGRPGGQRLPVDRAGDEPAMLARLLPEIPVVVGADRHGAGLVALERLDPRPDILVLDDGFSHLRLRRDLDILALPAADPFGGGRLWPTGRLREPLAAVSRAHAVVLTGAGPAPPSGEDVARSLAPFGFAGRGFLSAARTALDGLAAGGRALLVAAVARPESFAAAARSHGIEVAGQVFFRDHHSYPAASLERIARRAEALDVDAVLVTDKDLTKLEGRLRLPPRIALDTLALRAEPEPAFWNWLEAALGPRS
jgi:tetraacyldisaccharide 4'-kinase